MKPIRHYLRSLLALAFLICCVSDAFAGALPLLTRDVNNPILYRIRNTRRTTQGRDNYWKMPNGLTAKQEEAMEVYFTGVQTSNYSRVKMCAKDGKALNADFTWGEGTDWYMKEMKSAQGGNYTGVVISNATTFPDVTGNQPASDGLGCWYVGTNDEATWLYGGQWDGSIFTLEIVDPSREMGELIEIPQEQRPDISDGASRATVVKGDGYTTYTTKTDICVIVKMYDVDVTDCDYVLVKFAEPIPSGIRVAFWKQGGTDNVELEEGVTEYKYVFADDSKCAISNGVLPQVTLLTIYAGTAKTVKITGIYKHSTKVASDEPDPIEDVLEELRLAMNEARGYTVGTLLGQYTGTDLTPLLKEAEDYVMAGKREVEQVRSYIAQLKQGVKNMSLNLPAAGSELRLYCPALKSYVSAIKGNNRLRMVSQPNETSTVFVYDGKNLISKFTGQYTFTYELYANERMDEEVVFVPAYGNHPGLYTLEYLGGEKERTLLAEAAGTDCNRHYLSSQSSYNASTSNATAFELQLVSGDVIQTTNVTQQYLTNTSFEEGTKGWMVSSLGGGDVGSKPNSDAVYRCSGADGDYLFNTWISSDSHKGATQEHCAFQTVYGLQEGEYRLEVLAASNQNNPMTLFANHFTKDFVPREKGALTEHRLTRIYVTPEMKAVEMGVRSSTWFKCDRFVLTYMGKTKGYEDYVAHGMADADIMHPVMLNCEDGQHTDAFTYQPEEGAAGTYPSAEGGVQNDGTPADRSLTQLWTSSATTLGNSILSTTYTGLPKGYYKVSAHVRMMDEVGSVTKPVKGVTLFAGEQSTALTKGDTPAAGDKKAKAMAGQYAVVTEVTDGQLTAGFRLQDCTINWLAWQNFTLEYLGEKDPADDIINLNLEKDSYVALCLPYELKPEYFGDFYRVLDVTPEGKAFVTPYYKTSLAPGTPVLVKANGKNPDITLGDIAISSAAAGSKLMAWNNTLMVGTYDGFTWKADLTDRTVVEASQMQYEEVDLTNMDIHTTMENRAAQRFWAENPNYTTASQSTITNYLHEPTYNRRDQPNPVVVPIIPSKKAQRLIYSTDSTFASKTVLNLDANVEKAEVYNLIPGLTYYYYVMNTDQKGKFVAEGPLRMIYVGPNVYNVRDLGGKQVVDGRYVKYGKIFRSGELNGGYKATTEELSIMKKMGVGAEIDLRGEIDNSGAGTSAYGFRKGSTYYYVGGDHYIADEATKLANGDKESIGFWKEELEFAITNLLNGKGVNFHCRIGADRTGCLGLLLEGLLGVKEADLIRDYETTSFSTAAGTRIKHNTFDTGLKFIKNMIPTRGTLRDAFDKYVTGTLKVSKELIEQYREVMLADVPEAVGIEEVREVVDMPLSSGTYDLQGRKISEGAAQKGIYVKNGKKYVAK